MANKVSPIKPSEVAGEKEASFPDEVFQAFNELIIRNFSGGYARFQQEDVVELMMEKGLNRLEIFCKGWLDVEEVYRGQGWSVENDGPGWDESYSARYVFKARPKA